MLNCYVERAEVEDGMSILDLGCGWGSLCLYLAERFPKSKITALSNSSGQRQYIMGVANKKGFKNLEVITADINAATLDKQFDRIISIEMFEHMKNYEALFRKVSSWLKPETGRLFVHVFANSKMPYDFRTEDDNSWMARYFFTGGTMPSEDLFLFFQKDLEVLDRWVVDGTHYAKTSEEWLKRTDAAKDKCLPILAKTYGSDAQALVWFRRWRIFYIAVAELFNYNQGKDWTVVHYLFKRR
ncbi:hypothetical protein HK102_005064 [Quaeritorhiza haematococci]|nr:hypothetical protein HK102_005064 [Quaeritorhiza haematococci]